MKVLRKSAPVSVAAPRPVANAGDLATVVREETLDILTKAGIVKKPEKDGFKNYLITNGIGSGDIFPVMSNLKQIEESKQAGVITQWGRAVAPIVKKRYSLIPFAGKLLGSSPFFENHQEVFEAARKVKCPLIYAEDTDVLGFGTLNPVAGAYFATFVTKYFQKQNGITPYISMFLLDLKTWDNVCERQFAK